MMKFLFTLFLLPQFFSSCGQTTTNTTREIEKRVLKQKKNRINIPGTRAFIAPPNNFKIASAYIGLERDGNTGLTVMDMTAGNFYKNAATFSRKTVEERGVTVFDYQELTISGYPAKYLYMQANNEVKSHILIFGDSTFSTMVTAIFPASEEAVSREIKTALFAMRYDKKLILDPFDIAPFQVDDSKSKFKFSILSASIYMYSPSGRGPKREAAKDEPSLMLTPMALDNTMLINDYAKLGIEGLEKYGLTTKEIKNESYKNINGSQAYEAEVYGSMKGKAAVVYLCVLMKNDKIVFMQGIIPTSLTQDIAPAALQAILKDFKDFAALIEFKK